MINRIELNEAKYLEAMQILEFTDAQIEENRQHNGRLHLTDDVAIAALFDGEVSGVGVSVNHKTGEMVFNQVGQDLLALEQAFNDLVEQAYAKFNDPLRNPEHADAMQEFSNFLYGSSEQLWHDLGAP